MTQFGRLAETSWRSSSAQSIGVVVKDSVVHRRWSDPEVAAQLAQETIGDKAFKRELLSPAQMEKLGDEGKSFVAVASFKPEAGKRVVY